MGQDGKRILKLTGIFLLLCGIVTLIIGIMAYSNANKTSDTLNEIQKLANSQQRAGSGLTVSSRDAAYAPMREWVGRAKTYAMIMVAVSALHIIFGIIGFLMAEKTESAMLLVGFGGIMLVGALAVIIYPFAMYKKEYDAAQALMDMVLGLIPKSSGYDFTFDLISLWPFKHVITYSSVLLGGMYMWGAMINKGMVSPSVVSSSKTLGSTPVDPDAFFEQFNKPPVPPKAPAPQGQPRPQGAPMPQGQPRPQGAPMPQGQPRPQGAPMPQGQPRPQGAPMPQGQPRPQGAPMPQGQPRPQGAPMPQGQPRPQGAPMPQGQPRPQGAPMPQGQPRPQGAPMPQGQPSSSKTCCKCKTCSECKTGTGSKTCSGREAA